MYVHVLAQPATEAERWAPVGGVFFTDYEVALAECKADHLTTSIKWVSRKRKARPEALIQQFKLKPFPKK